MKKEITTYVARCDNYCRVKAIHLKSTGLLQPLSVPGWKWEEICIDFIVGLPPTQKNFNSIWVIVDRLTKSAHFIPVRTDYRPSDYAELYFNQIVRSMVYLEPLYLTEDLSSPLVFGNIYTRCQAPTQSEVLLIIHRPKDRRSG